MQSPPWVRSFTVATLGRNRVHAHGSVDSRAVRPGSSTAAAYGADVARIHTSFAFRSRIQAALGSGLAGSQPTDVQNSTAVSSAESTYSLRWRTKVRDSPQSRPRRCGGHLAVARQHRRPPHHDDADPRAIEPGDAELDALVPSRVVDHHGESRERGGRGPESELGLKIVRQPLEIGHREVRDLDRYVRHSP